MYFSKDNSKAKVPSLADKTEYVKQLQALLSSKDFRVRIKGIEQVVADCEENPCVVINNMFPVIYSSIFTLLLAALKSSLNKEELMRRKLLKAVGFLNGRIVK